MDIRNMSEDDLLDMDYFLNEDNLFDDEIWCRRFLHLLNRCRSICVPASVRAIFVQWFAQNRTFL